jgi:FtsZ-binding cell division protein ZapB
MAEQNKELESHTDLMLKMKQEHLLLSKEAEQAKAEKYQYKERLQMLRSTVHELRRENTSGQERIRIMLHSKDDEIE